MVRTFGVLFAACIGIVTIVSSASARTEPAPGCRWCGSVICCKEDVNAQSDAEPSDEKPGNEHRGSGRIADAIEVPPSNPSPTTTAGGGRHLTRLKIS